MADNRLSMDEYESETLSRDEAFDIVAVERRRVLIQVLLESDGEQDVEEVATEVATRLTESADGDQPENEEFDAFCEEIRIALLHHDLPKLADGEVVEYDYDDEVVEPEEPLEDVEALVSDE